MIKDVNISAYDYPAEPGEGGGGAYRLTRGPKRKMCISYSRKYIVRYFKYKIQKNNPSCEKGYV